MISILHDQILKEHQTIHQKLQNLQKQIKQLPEGKLICAHGKNCFKWFVSDGHEKTYLPKKERVLAEQLAIKKYLLLKMEELTIQKDAIESYLKHDFSKLGQSEKLITEHLGFQELLNNHFKPKSQELSEWMNSPYEKNIRYPERLIHKTSAGIDVRSKSEAMIVQVLHSHNIPFRYECALHIGSITLYPDFTIRHPKTGEVYYYEHFGRMNDTTYVNNVCSKLQVYCSCGIIPNIQLISTYETKEHPLTYEEIERVVKHYFLN